MSFQMHFNILHHSILKIIIVTSLIYVIQSSSGDDDYNFRLCVFNCINDNCQLHKSQQQGFFNIWSCEENCDYSCMRDISESRIRNGRSLYKYYGHWPFKRIFELQEPASVFFSLGHVEYHEHMSVCITLAILQSITWLIWIFTPTTPSTSSSSTSNSTYLSYSHKYICLFCQISFLLAALLEVLDFPPLFDALDAHSLWHAATIPIGFIWYKFWINDAQLHLLNKTNKDK
eukprot:gene8311-17107_t